MVKDEMYDLLANEIIFIVGFEHISFQDINFSLYLFKSTHVSASDGQVFIIRNRFGRC